MPQRTQAAQLNQQLHLEVATLRSPMRVDAIARNQLGLTVPVPGQVAPADARAMPWWRKRAPWPIRPARSHLI